MNKQMNMKECTWTIQNDIMFGFDNWEYHTTCGKIYDMDETTRENFCPHCGGKTIAKQLNK